jgi:hypothetical protein
MFYTNTLNAAPYTLIRSADANAQFSLVQSGFYAAEIKTSAAFKAPDGESPAILPSAVLRANKSFVFDALGAPTVATAATSSQMDAAVAAAESAALDAAAAAASAATLSGSVNAIQYLQIAQGIM